MPCMRTSTTPSLNVPHVVVKHLARSFVQCGVEDVTCGRHLEGRVSPDLAGEGTNGRGQVVPRPREEHLRTRTIVKASIDDTRGHIDPHAVDAGRSTDAADSRHGVVRICAEGELYDVSGDTCRPRITYDEIVKCGISVVGLYSVHNRVSIKELISVLLPLQRTITRCRVNDQAVNCPAVSANEIELVLVRRQGIGVAAAVLFTHDRSKMRRQRIC